MDLPIDNLYSTDPEAYLSANMGNTLRVMIENVEDDVDTINENHVTRIWTDDDNSNN